MSALPHSPAADRNKAPILQCLRGILGERGSMLEIAAGTGQHAVCFAAALPGWQWQPTDADAAMLPAIDVLVAQSRLPNVLPALHLDVTAQRWPPLRRKFDAVYCANMLHIAPWAACAALMAGAARHVVPSGLLIVYGPFLEEGVAPPAGNLAFKESLRERILHGACATLKAWRPKRSAQDWFWRAGAACQPTICCWCSKPLPRLSSRR